MRIIHIFSILFLWSYLACNSVIAQVDSKRQIFTDTVVLQIPQTSEVSTKSSGLALASNLLIPGTGDLYLGNQSRALYYFSSEATLILGAFFFRNYATVVLENSMSFASEYAGTRSNRDRDDEYWKILGYDGVLDSRAYNTIMELNGTYDKKFVSESEMWSWQNESLQNQYRVMRKKASYLKVASSFFIGGMILERIISFIDLKRRVQYSQQVLKGESGFITAQPTYSLNNGSVGFRLSYRF